MTATRSLWPEGVKEDAPTPVEMLAEQATYLENLTRGVVTAELVLSPPALESKERAPVPVNATRRPPGTTRSGQSIGFDLIAFQLDGYRFRLFDVVCGSAPLTYPVEFRFFDENRGEIRIARDEAEFMKILAEILQSDRTRSIVSSLKAASRDRIREKTPPQKNSRAAANASS